MPISSVRNSKKYNGKYSPYSVFTRMCDMKTRTLYVMWDYEQTNERIVESIIMKGKQLAMNKMCAT